MSNNNATNRKRKSSDALSQMAETDRDSSNTASQPADPEATTIPCPRCLHDVPLSNRRLHEINCARRVRADEEFFGQTAGTDNGAPIDEQTAVHSQFPFPRSGPPIPLSNTDSSHHNTAIAQSLADVMVDDARQENVEVRPRDGQEPYSLSYQDVPVPSAPTNPATASIASASSQNNDSGAQTEWSCPRCTLLNPRSATHCDACLFRRHINSNTSTYNTAAAMPTTASRPPDPIRSSRLIGDPFVSDLLHNEDEGWVNISHRDALRRITNSGDPNNVTPNRLSTGIRIFNSALNGAMIGSVFGGVGGMIFGAISGGLGGAYISSRQNAEEVQGTNEVEEVLREAHQNGTRNGVRVHRGRNHLIAISTENGSSRVLRLRYNGNARGGNAASQQAGDIAATEQALSELLLRMSHMHGLGGAGNVVIQPNLTYEELLERFGMGDENRRGASEEVIDSYPVVIVGNDEDDEKQETDLKKDDHDGNDNLTSADEKTVDYGTCGICLEDYAKGDSQKCLSCPHSFHKECIDRWLKRVASCPICKKEVEMYCPETVERKPPATLS